MKPVTLPPSLTHYVDDDAAQYAGGFWRDSPNLDSDPADRELVPEWTVSPRLGRVLRAANYTILAIAIGFTLWVAAQIFVAFHSGRVQQILRQSYLHMRVGGPE